MIPERIQNTCTRYKTLIHFKNSTFHMYLTNKEILDKLLLLHFQEKQSVYSCVNPIFQTIFKTFLKDKNKILNALKLPYSNAKLETTNNLIKVIERNAFDFRNFNNFEIRILIASNIKKERAFGSSPNCNFSLTHYS